MSDDAAERLPVVRACDLAAGEAEGPSWLLDGLWIDGGVGIIGGLPKCAKTFLALDMAVSVASGTPCLGRFAAKRRGGVLLYAAEDSPPIVRSRIEGLCAHRRLDLAELPIDVITVDTLSLDTARDRTRLDRTVAEHRPALLVLDPFVRIYGRIDENSAGEVSALLAYLRGLQRRHGCAVVVVHHARKNGPVSSPGNALRGSGDLYAWTDVTLFMARRERALSLTIEHRCAASPEPLALRLCDEDSEAVHLEPESPAAGTPIEPPVALDDRIIALVRGASPRPRTRAEIRRALGARNQTIGEALERLEQEGRLVRGPDGWTLAVVEESESSEFPIGDG